MRILKTLGIILIILVVLFTALLVTLSFIDINQYKDLIAQQVKDATGRELTLEGDLALEVSLTPSVVVQSVRFANAPWGSQPDMVAMARLEVEVALIPLINGEIDIKRFILIEPDILLETDEQGLGNWEIAMQEEQSQEQHPAQQQGRVIGVSVSELQIQNGRVSYRDGRTAETKTLHFDSLSLSKKADKHLEVKLEADYANLPFKLKGVIGQLDGLLKNKPFPLQLQVEGAGIDVSLAGQIAQPMQAKGIAVAVSLNAKQLDKLSQLIGAELPALSPIQLNTRVSNIDQGYAFSDLSIGAGESDISGQVEFTLGDKRPMIKAQLSSNVLDVTVLEASVDKQTGQQKERSPQAASSEPISLAPLKRVDADLSLQVKALRSTAMTLNDIDMAIKLKNGRLDIEPMSLRFAEKNDLSVKLSLREEGKRPYLNAVLSSKMLDLSVFEAKTQQLKQEQDKDLTQGKKATVEQRIFSAEPLSFQPLHSIDAEVSIQSKTIRTTSLVLDNLNVKAKLNRGKLDIKPLKINLAGGNVQADMTLDASSKTTQVKLNLEADQIELGKIEQLKALVQGGKSKVSIHLHGRGVSVRGIMAGLDGMLIAETDKGDINSAHINLLGSDFLIELIEKINPLAKQEGTSKMECAVIRFDIKDGMAKTDKGIAFQTSKMMVVGSGVVDLKQEKLNLGIKPEARKGIGAGAGQLAELVKLTGSLSDPGIGADAKGVAKLGATIGAAVATGGVSYLVQRGVSVATRDDTPCLTALGKTPLRASESSDSGAVESEQEDSKLKSGVNKLLKGAQGLFAR